MAKRPTFFGGIKRAFKSVFGRERPERREPAPPPPPPPRQPPPRLPPPPPGGAPPPRPVSRRAGVILEGYGPVVMSIEKHSQLKRAGQWYNVAGHYLRGGTTGGKGHVERDVHYWAARLQSMEGYTVSGQILEGPSDLVGTYVRNEPLETDPDVIDDWFERIAELDLISDANTPGSP